MRFNRSHGKSRASSGTREVQVPLGVPAGSSTPGAAKPRGGPPARRIGLILAGVVAVAMMALGRFGQRDGFQVDPLKRGLSAYSRGDWAAAEQEARRRLKDRSDDPGALRLLVRCLFRQGRDQAALGIAERLPRPGLDVEDYYLQGQAFMRLGQRERGILLWRAALGLDVNHVESLLALEQAFFGLDLLDEAAKAALRLASQPGWRGKAALLLAAVRAEQSDPGGAAAALRDALDHQDQWTGAETPGEVRKQLVRFLLRVGQPLQARHELRNITGGPDGAELDWLQSRCDIQQGIASSPGVAASASAYRGAHPLEPEPAPSVGAARCASCHPTQFKPQQRSRHARTFTRKERLASVPTPDRPVMDPGNRRVTHSFERDGRGLEIHTKVRDRVYETIVDYAFGSGDRGLTLVGHGPEGWPYEYRLSHYPDPVGWDVTSGQPAQPEDPALFQGTRINSDAVRRCLFCHTTQPFAVLTGAGPASSDSAIGCERCHGPGGHHLRVVSRAAAVSGAADVAIARPALATGAPIVALCSQCHSPRDKNLVVTPGAPDAVRFQGLTLTWSRCYSESGNVLDCVTCHDPHHDADPTPASYEAQCLSCHSPGSSSAGRGSHRSERPEARARVSCPIQPEHSCISCHMPRVKTPMAHAHFTDHFIRVHRQPDPAAAVQPADSRFHPSRHG
jgi:hypothetical protein